MFFNSAFDPDEMEREKKVVFEEIKMYEDTPDDIVHDLLARASYGEHPLGYPILGTEAHLNSFQPQTLKDYIQAYYTPENVVVSVAEMLNQISLQKLIAILVPMNQKYNVHYWINLFF